MANLAPIALFCFKRLDTLQRCVESLKDCPESYATELIIFSDGPRSEEEKDKVNKIRAFCKKIKGFKSIRINHRKENLGVDYNIILGIQEMSQEFENFIVVEDDLVVSNQFLRFMNAGLCHFSQFDKILTISAFNYVQIPNNYIWDCYFTQRANPWGWATWSNKIKEVDWDLSASENFLTNSKENKAFNAWGSDRSRMLKRTLKGEIRAWDIRLEYYQFKIDLFTCYSTKNLVLNNGFNRLDASNTIGYNRFKVDLSNFNFDTLNFPEFIFINPILKKRFISKNSIFNRLITTILKKIKFEN